MLCSFRQLRPYAQWHFPVSRGLKRRKFRCPLCGRRLRLKTIPDRQDGGINCFIIPAHVEK